MKQLKNPLAPYYPAIRICLSAIMAFSLYRLCFIIFNIKSIPDDTVNTYHLYARALLYGLNYDLVIACYFIAPFLLFIFLNHLSGNKLFRGFYFFKWYFYIAFIICFFICAVDIPYYKQFGGHLNKGFFVWIESPGFILKLIFSDIAYWGYLLLFLLLSAFFIRRASRIFIKLDQPAHTEKRFTVPVFIILALLTFIGIRGRTSPKSPIRVGTAFFSEHVFFNQLGLNPCFVFFQSLTDKQKEWEFLTEDINSKELQAAMQKIADQKRYVITAENERSYSSDTLPKNYNVVVVLMESMSMTKLGYYNCDKLTNRLDSLIKEGLFFDHFYSAGIHTFNGLFSTETGFPAIMDVQPLNKYTEKPFKGISYWLRKNGYSNYFFTSHDSQFDNMEGFFMLNEFDRIYSESDFSSNETNGPLGVFDHYLFGAALEKINEHVRTKKSPFFSYILTSSDHGPWEIPDNIPFKPDANKKQDRATQYADWALGDFIEKAKKHDWFKKTIFVFVADHGGNLGHTYSMPLSYNHIPCLFYMPSEIGPDTISTPGGQIDVLSTLLSFLKIPFKNTSMGIDLAKETRPYMYFTADNKIGCIDDKYYYINLLDEQKELLYEYKDLNRHSFLNDKKVKADSMKNYATLMLKTANYIIKNKKY